MNNNKDCRVGQLTTASVTFIFGSIIVFFVLSFLIVFHNNRLFSYPDACFCNYIFIMILVPGCMLAYNLHHDSSSSHVLLRFSPLLWRFPHKELRRKLRVSQNMIFRVIILAGIFYNWFSFAKPSRQVREGMYEKTICSVSWSGLVGHPLCWGKQLVTVCFGGPLYLTKDKGLILMIISYAENVTEL